MAVQKVFLLNQNTPVNIPSGLVPKGAYNAGTDYAVGDSVDYNGSSYVMFVDAVAGTLPTDTTKWQVLANKGATGATGATGAAGAAGANGQGVPIGGTAGQVLAKIDATDYNTQWITSAGTGDALVANPLSQFAATTSLQLKGVISDETGSGALVFADTPTLVTPVLGEATGTGITLSGLTASEMVITNGSKKLVSAAVATYPSLTELTYVKGVTSAIQTQLGGKVSDTGDTMTGALTIGLAGNALSLTNSTDNASVQVAIFEGDRATITANDEAYLTFQLSDSIGTQTEFARLTAVATDVVNGSEDGAFDFSVLNNGVLTKYIRLNKLSLSPSTNDALPLGSSGTAWSDLFLASGGVINWNAGNMTLTHAAGSLTVSNGNFGIGGTTPGVRFYITKTTTVDTFIENMIQMQAGPSGNQDAFTVDNLGNMALNAGGQANGGFTTVNSKVNADSTVDIFNASLARGSGNGGVGLGLGYLFRLEGGGGSITDAGRFKYVWSTATAGSETATFTIQNKSAGSLVDALVLVGPNATFQGTLSIGTSNALTAGTIELGHASDTTLSRSSAGVLAVEGEDVAMASNIEVKPSNHNLIGWTFDPLIANNNYALQAAGTLYGVRIYIGKATTISNVIIGVQTAGGTLANSYVALYQNGTLLTQSADQSTSWQSTGMKTIAITPQSVSKGSVDVVFWCGSWATAPNFYRAGGQTGTLHTVGQSTTEIRFFSADTGKTTTAPGTLGAKTALIVAYWVGLS